MAAMMVKAAVAKVASKVAATLEEVAVALEAEQQEAGETAAGAVEAEEMV